MYIHLYMAQYLLWNVFWHIFMYFVLSMVSCLLQNWHHLYIYRWIILKIACICEIICFKIGILKNLHKQITNMQVLQKFWKSAMSNILYISIQGNSKWVYQEFHISGSNPSFKQQYHNYEFFISNDQWRYEVLMFLKFEWTPCSLSVHLLFEKLMDRPKRLHSKALHIN